MRGLFCRRPDGRAVDRFSRFGAHAGENAPGLAHDSSKSRLSWKNEEGLADETSVSLGPTTE
jgi:hypothetical protein